MATPEEERTRDRVAWIAAATMSNSEAMKDARVSARQQGETVSVDDVVVEAAVLTVAKIESSVP